MPLSSQDIARVCHEANRAYCQSLGDASQIPWDDAAEWQRTSAIRGVEAKLTRPEMTAEEQHGQWLKDKLEHGWVYGETKDVAAKTHPCIVPYLSLPEDQRRKDALFGAIVLALKP